MKKLYFVLLLSIGFSFVNCGGGHCKSEKELMELRDSLRLASGGELNEVEKERMEERTRQIADSISNAVTNE